jgi:hypothetical protein
MTGAMMFMLSLILAGAQAAPPPVTFLDHAPPSEMTISSVAECNPQIVRIERRRSEPTFHLRIEFDGVEISPDNETKILELSPVSNPQAGLAVLCNPQSVMLIVTHGADEYAVIFDGRTVRSLRKNNYEHPPVTEESR